MGSRSGNLGGEIKSGAHVNKLLEWLNDWTNRHRPTALLVVVALTIGVVALLNWTTGSDLYQQIFYPKRETIADVRFWSALVYGLAFITGLPVAFLLWQWRDRNVRDQIENTRNDTNLKEFQEVQLRAAGALDEKLPAEAREALQIAALHQLRGFLRGEYGESFKRPAFELFCAGLAQTDVLSFNEWRTAHPPPETPMSTNLGDRYLRYVENQQNQLDKVSLARNKIVSEEWKSVFRSGFPLQNRNFSFVHLPANADLTELNLNGCRFIRSGLDRVNFKNAMLRFTILDCAIANGAQFSKAEFFGASLVYCGLSTHINDDMNPRSMSVDFCEAALTQVDLQYAVVIGGQLQGARFFSNKLGEATLVECKFDRNTQLEQNWAHMTFEEQESCRQIWAGRGAVNVDMPFANDMQSS